MTTDDKFWNMHTNSNNMNDSTLINDSKNMNKSKNMSDSNGNDSHCKSPLELGHLHYQKVVHRGGQLNSPQSTQEWFNNQMALNKNLYDTIAYYSENIPTLEPEKILPQVRSKRKKHGGRNEQIRHKDQSQKRKENVQKSGVLSQNETSLSFGETVQKRVEDDFQWLFQNKMEWQTQKVFKKDFLIEELGIKDVLPTPKAQVKEIHTDELSLFLDKYNDEAKYFQLSYLSQVRTETETDLQISKKIQYFQRYYARLPNDDTLVYIRNCSSAHQAIAVLYQIHIRNLLFADTCCEVNHRHQSSKDYKRPKNCTQPNLLTNSSTVPWNLHQKFDNSIPSQKFGQLWCKHQEFIQNHISNLHFTYKRPNIVPPVESYEVPLKSILSSLKMIMPNIHPEIIHWINHIDFRKKFIIKLLNYFQAYNQATMLPVLVKRNNKYFLIHGVRWRGCDIQDQESFLSTKFKKLGLYQGIEGFTQGVVFNNYPYFHIKDGSACISTPKNIPSHGEVEDFFSPINTTPKGMITKSSRLWSLYPSSKEDIQLYSDRYNTLEIKDCKYTVPQLLEFIDKNPLFLYKTILDARKANQSIDSIQIRNPNIQTLRRLHILNVFNRIKGNKRNQELKFKDFLEMFCVACDSDEQFQKNFLHFLKQKDSFLCNFTPYQQIVEPFHPYEIELEYIQFHLLILFPFLQGHLLEGGEKIVKYILELLSLLRSYLLLESQPHNHQETNFYQEFSMERNCVVNRNLTPNSNEELAKANPSSLTTTLWYLEYPHRITSPLIKDINNEILSRIRKVMHLKHHSLTLASLFFSGLFDPNAPSMFEAFKAFHTKSFLQQNPDLAPLISRSLSLPIPLPTFILNRTPPTTIQVLIAYYLSFHSHIKNTEYTLPNSITSEMTQVTHDEYTDTALNIILTTLSQYFSIEKSQLLKHSIFLTAIQHLILQYYSKKLYNVPEDTFLHEVLQYIPKLWESNNQWKPFTGKDKKLLSEYLWNSGHFNDENDYFDLSLGQLTEFEKECATISQKLSKYWNFHWKDISCPTINPLPTFTGRTIVDIDMSMTHSFIDEALSNANCIIDPLSFFTQKLDSPCDYLGFMQSALDFDVVSNFNSVSLSNSHQPEKNRKVDMKVASNFVNTLNTFTTLLPYQNIDLIVPGLITNEIGFFQLGADLEEASNIMLLPTMIFAAEKEDELINTKTLLRNPFASLSQEELVSLYGSVENRLIIARETIRNDSKSAMISSKMDEYSHRKLDSSNLFDSPLHPSNEGCQKQSLHPEEYLFYCLCRQCLDLLVGTPEYTERRQELQDVLKQLVLMQPSGFSSKNELKLIESELINNSTYTSVDENLVSRLRSILVIYTNLYEEEELETDFLSFLIEPTSLFDSSSGVNGNPFHLTEIQKKSPDMDFYLYSDASSDEEQFHQRRNNNEIHNLYNDFFSKTIEEWAKVEATLLNDKEIDYQNLDSSHAHLLDNERSKHVDMKVMKLDTWYKFVTALPWSSIQKFIPSHEVSTLEINLQTFSNFKHQTFKIFQTDFDMLSYNILINRSLNEGTATIKYESFVETETSKIRIDKCVDTSTEKNYRYSKENWIPFRTETPEESFGGGHCELLVQILDLNDEFIDELLNRGENTNALPVQWAIPSLQDTNYLRNLKANHNQFQFHEGTPAVSIHTTKEAIGWMDLDAFVGTGCSEGEGLWLGYKDMSFLYDPAKTLQENLQINTQIFQSNLNILQNPQKFQNSGNAIPDAVYNLEFAYLNKI